MKGVITNTRALQCQQLQCAFNVNVSNVYVSQSNTYPSAPHGSARSLKMHVADSSKYSIVENKLDAVGCGGSCLQPIHGAPLLCKRPS
jgi:hypothetical protein